MAFQCWLSSTLQGLGADGEEIAAYVQGVLDVSSTSEEASEALHEFLGEATSDNVDDAVAAIVARWAQERAASMVIDAVARERELLRVQAAAATAAMVTAAVATTVANAAAASAVVTDQALKRSVLAAARAYEELPDSDDESEAAQARAAVEAAALSKTSAPSKKERRAWKETSASDVAVAFVNSNHSIVANAAAKQRDDSRAKAAAVKDRDKAALEADRERKRAAEEKRKACAQKGERKR